MVARLPYYVFFGIMLSSCSTTTVSQLPCPPRPIVEAFSIDEQLQMGEQAVLKVARNQLKLKKYAKDLEAIAGCQ